MLQNIILAVGIVLLLNKYCLVGAVTSDPGPGDGWYYSGSGGYEDRCPISACQTDCDIGYYRSGCSGNSTGSCVPCTNKPLDSYYNTKGHLISDCTWACMPGFLQSGLTCVENSKCTKSIPQYATYSSVIFPECDHQCNAGYFNAQTSTNPTSCSACQAGTYSLQGATACTLCPEGTFSNIISSPSKVNCQECLAGTYSVQTGATQSSVCLSCQAGTYSTTAGASAETSCQACPEGSFSALAGANSVTICTSCTAGKYNSITGRTACAYCNAGTYASATGSTKCNTCALNSYASTAGMISCIPCEICDTPGIYKTNCGPISAGYCVSCTNPSVQ